VKLATRAKIGILVVGAAVVALAMPAPWWKSAGRDEKAHQKTAVFEAAWQVTAGDLRQKLRTDNAHIVWHAGDEHTHNDVHHGGKYVSEPVVLGPGVYLLSLTVNVDAATTTTCKIHFGKQSIPGAGGPGGHCAVSLTVVVK
jgi:hypothetical protein